MIYRSLDLAILYGRDIIIYPMCMKTYRILLHAVLLCVCACACTCTYNVLCTWFCWLSISTFSLFGYSYTSRFSPMECLWDGWGQVLSIVGEHLACFKIRGFIWNNDLSLILLACYTFPVAIYFLAVIIGNYDVTYVVIMKNSAIYGAFSRPENLRNYLHTYLKNTIEVECFFSLTIPL